ncbi:hypothetical protein [Alkalimonas amylolytica]|uniref:Uncharacterized protein n=1 Tax=Alkalimonas amylolytica TaxID=152573 RepID=A0A1H4ENT9_ALKAM|nr:hypothetical protein [Alkalimonas amylolytica]SEA86725.1 hypothetical protein SAMN04488051_107164 [Alkalimonas amylolytica]
MALEICITTNPVTREWITCPEGYQFSTKNETVPQVLATGTPYLIESPENHAQDHRVLQQFQQFQRLAPSIRRDYVTLHQQYGEPQLNALSAFYAQQMVPTARALRTQSAKLSKEMPTLTGAVMTSVERRLDLFGKYTLRYQQALENYRVAFQSKVRGAPLRQLAKNVHQAHQQLNAKFRSEIQRLVMQQQTTNAKANAWTDPNRALNQARSGRSDQAIRLQEHTNLQRMHQFLRTANQVGRGMLVLDAGIRVSDVRQVQQDGGDWHRSLAQQMTGFGLGGAAAMSLGGLAVQALTVMLMATPYGWVYVIVGGVVVGLTAGYLADAWGKWAAGTLYDQSQRLFATGG